MQTKDKRFKIMYWIALKQEVQQLIKTRGNAIYKHKKLQKHFVNVTYFSCV